VEATRWQEDSIIDHDPLGGDNRYYWPPSPLNTELNTEDTTAATIDTTTDITRKRGDTTAATTVDLEVETAADTTTNNEVDTSTDTLTDIEVDIAADTSTDTAVVHVKRKQAQMTDALDTNSHVLDSGGARKVWLSKQAQSARSDGNNNSGGNGAAAEKKRRTSVEGAPVDGAKKGETQKQYTSGWKRYAEYCDAHSLNTLVGDQDPASQILEFARYLMQNPGKTVKSAVANSYVSAVGKKLLEANVITEIREIRTPELKELFAEAGRANLAAAAVANTASNTTPTAFTTTLHCHWSGLNNGYNKR
jgi:hypothetical protein